VASVAGGFSESRSASASVAPTGAHQAGIAAPSPAQSNLLMAVADLAGPAGPAAVANLLGDLGRAVVDLTTTPDPRLAGVAAGDLTITIGVGPRVVAGLPGALPGFVDLPQFQREAIEAPCRGGDLMIQVCATDPIVPPLATAALLATAGKRLVERWRQPGSRGPHVPVRAGLQAPRNVFGFVDGIVNPVSAAEFDHDVWIFEPERLAGASIAVVRRMQVDVTAFTALPLAAQQAVFGRTRDTAVPLSGRTIADDPNLEAKTPDGRYVIPAAAHIRRANPREAGVPLMLRRSYSFAEPTAGLLFISFQNSLDTFIRTMRRMESGDALLPFTTTTASATFLVLPGFDDRHPLGSTLWAD
jgi:dye decolorizing peroxidase